MEMIKLIISIIIVIVNDDDNKDDEDINHDNISKISNIEWKGLQTQTKSIILLERSESSCLR